LASGGLILNFLGATGGPEISLGAAAPSCSPVEPSLEGSNNKKLTVISTDVKA